MPVDDAIAAITTPIGEGGVGIIRISGGEIKEILAPFLNSRFNWQVRYVHFTPIYDPQTKQVLDEACVIYFKGPASYTGEDVVEIQCHSSPYILQQILSRLIQEGCRLAEKGEFTKRAFMNGKMDLTQAEAVIDVIQADSAQAHQVSLGHVKGQLYEKITQVKSALMPLLEQLEGAIDFPDEVPAIPRETLRHQLRTVHQDLDQIQQVQDWGAWVKSGVTCMLLGPPNVGKSSLFNRLSGEDKAIVTPHPGTTRDVLDVTLQLGGFNVHILDTAGMRDSDQEIEQMGINRAKERLSKVDILLWVLDQSQPFSEADMKIAATLPKMPMIIIKNKADLGDQLTLPDEYSSFSCCRVSAKTKVGLSAVKEEILSFIQAQVTGMNLGFLCNTRQRGCLDRAHSLLSQMIVQLDENQPDDLISFDLRQVISILAELSGDEITESLLDGIFSRFCVGK